MYPSQMALSVKTAVWVGLCISALFCGNQIRYTSNTNVVQHNTDYTLSDLSPEDTAKNILRSLRPSSTPLPDAHPNASSTKARQGDTPVSVTPQTRSVHLNGSSTKNIVRTLDDEAIEKQLEVDMVDVPRRPLLRFKLISKADSEARRGSDGSRSLSKSRLLKKMITNVQVLPKKYGKYVASKGKAVEQGEVALKPVLNDYENGVGNASVDYVTYERPLNTINAINKQQTILNHNVKENDTRVRNETLSSGHPARQTTLNPWHGKSPKIPHIIHQTWDSAEVPRIFSEWMQTWRKHHPDWEYWFWTQEDVRLFLSRSYPDFLPQYDAYDKDIYRANAMRFYVMYHFGGVYADLDLESLKPMDPWTYTEHCFLPEETYAHPIILRQQEKSNAMITLLACRPHHPFFKLAIDMLPTYNELEYESKLLYIDNVYRKFTSGNNSGQREEETVKLVHPEYFLPTYDAGWTARIRSICQASSILPAHQRDVCDVIAKDDYQNVPKNTSYTNHHWVHVVMFSDSWKRKNTHHISSIIPNTKDLQSLLRSL